MPTANPGTRVKEVIGYITENMIVTVSSELQSLGISKNARNREVCWDPYYGYNTVIFISE